MKFSLFILIILFFANCSSRKHTASFCQQTDSLLQTSRLTVQTARIPESRADIPFRSQPSKSCLPAPPLSKKADRQQLKSVSYMTRYLSLPPAIACKRSSGNMRNNWRGSQNKQKRSEKRQKGNPVCPKSRFY